MNIFFTFFLPVFFLGNSLPSNGFDISHVISQAGNQGTQKIISLLAGLKKIPEKNILPAIPSEETTLSFWIFDANPDDFVWPIQLFEERTETIKIVPRFFSEKKAYRSALQEAIAKEDPPDFALVPDDFFPEFSDKLTPASLDFFSPRECNDFFFSFSCSAFSQNGKIFGVPLFVKSSVILVNSDLFRDDRIALGDQPAGNWDDFLENWDKFQSFQKDKDFLGLSPETAGEMMAGILVQGTKSLSLRNLAIALENLKKFSVWEEKPLNLEKKFGDGKVGIIWGDFELLTKWKLAAEIHENRLRESALLALPAPQVDEQNPRNLGRTLAFVVPKGVQNPGLSWATLAFFAEQESLRAIQSRSGRRVAWKFFGPFDSEKNILKNAYSPIGTTGSLEFSQVFAENGADFFAGTLSSEDFSTILFPFLK